MTLHDELAALASPPWQVAGVSVEGRAILVRQWEAAAAGVAAPPVLLFGGIHGNEPLGVGLLLRLANELDAPGGVRPRRPTWIVPVVNPDGLARGQQDNARGVDLNRNFPAASWRADHPPGHHPGASPASEPEVVVLAGLIARSRAARLIALHSPFRTVNYDGPAAALAERMAAHNGYGASADIGYPTPGSLGSLYGKERGLEVITLEIPPLSPEQAWTENRLALLEALDVAP